MARLLRSIALVKRLREVVACAALTDQWISLSLAYLKITKLDYPYRIHLRTGEVMFLREFTDLAIFWLIFPRDYYPVDPDARTILDVGSNIGIFALYAARKASFARIIAVEPFPSTCERLEETIRENHLQERVTVMRCALTASEGKTLMDDTAEVPSQYRSVLSDVPRMLNREHKNFSEPEGGVAVPTLSLAGLLARCRVDCLDLLKMNIHGNEYEVLLSSPESALRRVRKIAVQYHELPSSSGLSKKDLFRKLQGVGFELMADADTGQGAGRAILSLAA